MSIAGKVGTFFLVVAVAAAAFALLRSTRGAVQSSRPTSPASRVLRDSMEMCQITVPDGWQVGKTGSIWAYGPEGSSAELVIGPGTGTWEEEKRTAQNFYGDRKRIILRNDASNLTFEITPASAQGYSIVGVSPGKSGYCTLELKSGAPDARSKFAADFKKMSDSLKAVQ